MELRRCSRIALLAAALALSPAARAANVALNSVRPDTPATDTVTQQSITAERVRVNALATSLNGAHGALEALGAPLGTQFTDVQALVTAYVHAQDGFLGQLLAAHPLTVAQYRTLRDAHAQQLIGAMKIYKWGHQIDDEVFQLLDAVGIPADPAHAAPVRAFKDEVNNLATALHPGISKLDVAGLKAHFNGAGVTVAVLDYFDEAKLQEQARHYASATFQHLQKLGAPASQEHGNEVIDILLTVAPNITVLPVSAAPAQYTAALQALAQNGAVSVVNISQGWNQALDDAAVAQLAASKILVKSLGNKGKALSGGDNSYRLAGGTGTPAFDTGEDNVAIPRLLGHLAAHKIADRLLLAVTLSPFGNSLGYNSSTPGTYAAVQERTLGAPSDGIFARTSGNFESGSSYGAPQLAGVAALLLQQSKSLRPAATPADHLAAVVKAMRTTAKAVPNLGKPDVGLGLLDAGAASAAVAKEAKAVVLAPPSAVAVSTGKPMAGKNPVALAALGLTEGATAADVLGIKHGASKAEVKKAFKAMALKWHPDKNKAKDARDVFQLVCEAYDELSK